MEDTCVREVKEEVGLNVTEVKYLASQPWPFPPSLMLGCEATASNFSEIKVEIMQDFTLQLYTFRLQFSVVIILLIMSHAWFLSVG